MVGDEGGEKVFGDPGVETGFRVVISDLALVVTLVNAMQSYVGIQYQFLLLLPGPVLGLIALRRLASQQ